MKLKCTIGSLSCDGVVVERGDTFEMPDDAAKGLIESGYACESTPTKSEVPDETWTVAELKDRLDQMNVEYPTRGTKAELLDIITDTDE